MTSKFDEFLNTEIEGTTAPDVQVIQLTREDLDLIITKAVNKKFTHLKINLMDTINFHMNAYISDNKNFGNRTRADILIEIGRKKNVLMVLLLTNMRIYY